MKPYSRNKDALDLRDRLALLWVSGPVRLLLLLLVLGLVFNVIGRV